MLTFSDITSYVNKYFYGYMSYQEIWRFIQSHPEFVREIGKEIDEAVRMFNNYRKSSEQELHSMPIPSSLYLKAIIKEDLPTCKDLIHTIDQSDDKELVEKVMVEISGFDFIDTLRPIENCAAALLLGSYRCAMRIIYPYIKQKNGQVASSLEEMIGLMALDGKKRKLFDAVRHWYVDWEEEGFSKEFSEAVQKL